MEPGNFIEKAVELAGGERMAWASSDMECMFDTKEWKARNELKEEFELVSGFLGLGIARMAAKAAAAGRFIDALTLDANYVRRSDAEVFWKGKLAPRGAETKREHTGSRVRAFRPNDAVALTSILRDAPEAANWTQESYREWMNSPGAVAFVHEVDGRVTGFIVGRQVADEAEVLNLAVAPMARRKGQGRALLKAALDEFRARGASRVYLEVRESNAAAMAFYEKHGFSKTGRRSGYYREPNEAAAVMENRLTC
jgi:ribosomal-protein-alanine N-acetyltransferase